MESGNKIWLISLICIVAGSMIGAGIFTLPQNIAARAGVVAASIGWFITFVGMMSLTLVFQNLSIRRPDLNAGVYAYARECFGDYLGFSSAWGYCISAWIGTVSYLIIFCSALSFFIPQFGNGVNLLSLGLSSIMIWGIALLNIKGIKPAALFNTIITSAKIIIMEA